MKVWKAGIIGCGNIADVYVRNIQTYFKNLQIKSCAAKHLEHARDLAGEIWNSAGCGSGRDSGG